MKQTGVKAKERFHTVVIGGGQAGLAAGYYLATQRGDISTGSMHRFVILDAHDRLGDSWRTRWDSLRLFTPASFNSLPGMPFPGPRGHLPTKDEMADYLQAYAARFQLPVQINVKVETLTRDGKRYIIDAGARRLEASHVVVATGAYATPRVPAFASHLDPAITQFHSRAYRNPGQLREGPVLVVGAGNSGSEIAMDVAAMHPTWLAGRDTGHVPALFARGGVAYGVVGFALRALNRLTVDTRLGRRMVHNARAFTGGHPVVRVRPQDLKQAGVQRVPRVAGVTDGQPVLEGGRALDVANVVWATGFGRDFSWIKLPVVNAKGEPIHHRGVVHTEPGLYFTGMPFQSSVLSGLVAGAGGDANHIVRQIFAEPRGSSVTRARATDPAHGGTHE